jgi:hypothetical protein
VTVAAAEVASNAHGPANGDSENNLSDVRD